MADAEDRTEAATAKRLDNAREQGQAPVTREMAAAAVLAVATLAMAMQAGPALRGLLPGLTRLLAMADRTSPMEGVRQAATLVAQIAAPVALMALIAGSAAILLQTGFLFHGSTVMPDLGRLDPRRGLSRIAGPTALLETGKSLVKIAVVGGVLYRVLGETVHDLPAAFTWGPARLADGIGRHVAHALIAVLGAQSLIATADLLRARFQHGRSLRMSRQEVRDEHKESDGDPHIKGRRRAIQRQRARRRMLAAVPKAAVVITNPTHYAVALAYDRGAQAAPKVVAKGMDEMAARIREAAAKHGVPLVANAPLARALHQVELDQEIPAEHYKAVAEIIAYVWRLRGQVAGHRARM